MSILASGETITKIMDSEGNVLIDVSSSGGDGEATTIGGNLPLVFESDGSTLTDYTIYGNIGGVGNYNSATRKYDIPVTVTSDNLLENNSQSEIYNGLTVTVNADSSITVNGTATRSGGIVLYDSGFYTGGLPASVYQEIANGSYILSGSPEGSAVGSYILSYRYTPAIGEVTSQAARVSVDGVTLNNTTGTYKYLAVYIAVWQGATLDNVTFRPSLKKVNTVTLSRDTALTFGNTLSLSDTNVDLPTYNGMNTLTIGTTIQPQKVCLTGNVSYVSDGGAVSFDSLRSSTTIIDLSNMTEIPDECCMNMNSLQYVLISINLTRIGDRAFYGQKNFLCLSPNVDSLLYGNWEFYNPPTYIGDEAFRDAYYGSSLNLDNIAHIGHRAFYNSNCEGSTISSEYIGDEAFYSNNNAPWYDSSIVIPSTATYIGHKAFYMLCNPYVKFPNTPVNIMPDAFEGVTGIYMDGTLWSDFDIDNFDLSGYVPSTDDASEYTSRIISKLKDRTGLTAYTLILSDDIDSSCLTEIATAASAKNWNITTR